ncbi:SdrD B-like domain-containing protein [Segetibacter aerophilus]|uniref:SD-repeat containing protein B domain-containing protein n=1 Tax=Segetibacter aerophilus TaxID=670293 RepID=A0A512B9H6_9BACT|nr:SdrD B-like domain-containing protein [Segetibacter aerophilus]GEO08610.1 hypothetical protein SAE01_11060 [Segetibacter aerophilus]
MKIFTRGVLLLLLTPVFLTSFGQTVISTETFPAAFNATYTTPMNTGFYESIGKWIGYTSDARSVIAVDNKQHFSGPFALRLQNNTTTNLTDESTNRATGPIVNLPCATAATFNFKIFNLNVNPANTYFYLFVLLSKDNGSTWTPIMKKSASELINSYGTNQWSDVSLQVPSEFFNSSVRYRFIGCHLPGSSFENTLYIDDIKLISTPCATTSNLKLGNQIWNDFDGDGKRDLNEPSIAGAAISLYTDNNSDNLPDGAAFKTTTSDAQGRYLFSDLAPGRYIASMPILPGYQQSPNSSTQEISPFPDLNIDDVNKLVRLIGPNGPGGILYTNAITLSAGDEPTTDGDDGNGNLTFDLAECGNGYIGDFVRNDLNGNGIQEASEPGLNGVEVTITFPDGITSTTNTGTYNAANNSNAPHYDGYYNFPNLGPGTYKITFATPAGFNASPANAGSNDAKDSDPVNGAPVLVTLEANQSDFTIDAGFTKFTPPPVATCINLSVGNLVFSDLNGNGIKELSEPGISGLTVKLYADDDGNNVPDGAALSTVMTDEEGTYLFSNLAAGKYIVGVTTGSTYTLGTINNANADDNKNNDNNGVRTVSGEVRSNFITLSAGDEPINDGSDNNSNLSLDFGLVMAGARISNMVNTDAVGTTSISVFPNPTSDYVTVKVDATASGAGIVRITDGLGHLITTKNITLRNGANTITFTDFGKLNAGKYNVQLLFNYHVYNQQMILVK